MSRFVIEGGRPLIGTVRPSGNKNEALPVLAACLLTDQPVTLKRMPQIGDVLTFCAILQAIGVTVEWTDEETVVLDAKNAQPIPPPEQLCGRVRASILLLGPLLARFGKASIPRPGGDVIGARRIDSHWEGLQTLGCTLKLEGVMMTGSAPQLKGTDIYMDEPSVTGTENLVMAAVLAEGTTILHNSASEPHVVGLCRLLNAMGAKISGIGSNRLTIDGVSKLHGTTHEIGPDFMEVGGYLCLGAMTGGKIQVESAGIDDFRFILKALAKIGVHPEVSGNSFVSSRNQPMQIQPDISGRTPTIYSGPWPAFPTDLMSVAIVAATQAEGTVIFFEKMFEGRMFFTDKLIAMAATIILCDPHRVVVSGPSRLQGVRMSSPDIRAGMALVMAALVAQGKSEIDNIVQIERGYYRVDRKLEQLGAAIRRVESN
jgi:UDP-N-acetylglucosamine 1-carboxyvinyltransferase